jgi:hypothetical protein
LKVIRENNSETLLFSDNIVKEDIRELKNILINSIDKSEIVNITFANVKKTDMFFVQLLCSAHKYAVYKKKKTYN